MTIICISTPGTAELYQIGYAISLALNPDKGYTNNFGSEFVPDAEGNPVRPEVYTTFDFPCSETFAQTAQALAADPTKMHAAVTADYAQRWPDLTPPTLEQCAVFCGAVDVTVYPVVEPTQEP